MQLNFEYVEVCPVFWQGVQREWRFSNPGVKGMNEGFSSGVSEQGSELGGDFEVEES
jgi:hypothetical protein